MARGWTRIPIFSSRCVKVAANDLVTQAAEFSGKTSKGPEKSHVLADDQLEDVFGLEMAIEPPVSPVKFGERRSRSGKESEDKTRTPAKKEDSRKTGKKWVASTGSPPTPVKKDPSTPAKRKAMTSPGGIPKTLEKKGTSPSAGKKAAVSSGGAPKTSAKKGASPTREKKALTTKSRKS